MDKTSGAMAPDELLPLSIASTQALFGLSGNACAFSGCSERLIDPTGSFVGEIGSIETSDAAGPRHNPEITEVERLHHSNLVLLCRAHKLVTDDEQRYTATLMRDLKRRHEEPLLAQPDLSEDAPRSLNALARELGWKLTKQQLDGTLKLYRETVADLRAIPPPARDDLLILLELGKEHSHGDFMFAAHELEARSRTPNELKTHLQMFSDHNLAELGNPEDALPQVVLFGRDGFWNALKRFCDLTDRSLKLFVRDLRFESLE
jgi:hypothetical protein